MPNHASLLGVASEPSIALLHCATTVGMRGDAIDSMMIVIA
jgi:hypothetical protein